MSASPQRTAPSGDAFDPSVNLSIESDEIYRVAAELAGLIVWSADHEGVVISMSSSFTDITGLPPGSHRSAMHPEDAEEVMQAWHEATAAGRPHAAEFRMRVRDGSWRHFRARSGPRRGPDGRIVGWFGFTEDIHDRKLAELALTQMEERYRLAVRATDDAIYDLDLVAREIRWRDKSEGFFGYPGQDRPTPLAWWEDKVHPEDRDRLVAGLEQVLASDIERWTVQYRFRKADGDYADLHDQGIIVRDSQGRPLRAVGAMRDVTKVRRAEAELRRMQAELIHVSRRNAMGTMASTLAHELNQPLAATSNYINGARRMARNGKLPAPLIDALDSAAASALRAGEIVRRLRELVARGSIAASPAFLPTLIEEAGVLGFVDSGLKGIRRKVELDPKAQWVWADAIQIQQVLINLIRNAVEAMEGSTVREVRISTRKVKNMIEIAVADTGPGIDPSRSDELFSQFFTTKDGGMGVGLPISRTIVEAHGGKMRVAKGEDGGAVFAFTLPASNPRGKAPKP